MRQDSDVHEDASLSCADEYNAHKSANAFLVDDKLDEQRTSTHTDGIRWLWNCALRIVLRIATFFVSGPIQCGFIIALEKHILWASFWCMPTHTAAAPRAQSIVTDHLGRDRSR